MVKINYEKQEAELRKRYHDNDLDFIGLIDLIIEARMERDKLKNGE